MALLRATADGVGGQSSSAAPPSCNRNRSSTALCASWAEARASCRDTRRGRSTPAAARSRSRRRDVTPCSPSARTSSGSSRCGRVTTPRPRSGSTRPCGSTPRPKPGGRCGSSPDAERESSRHPDLGEPLPSDHTPESPPLAAPEPRRPSPRPASPPVLKNGTHGRGGCWPARLSWRRRRSPSLEQRGNRRQRSTPTEPVRPGRRIRRERGGPGRERGRPWQGPGQGRERTKRATRRWRAATGGPCAFPLAHPGIASSWTAAGSRSMEPNPSSSPAAHMSSRLEAVGRPSPSISVAEVRFS